MESIWMIILFSSILVGDALPASQSFLFRRRRQADQSITDFLAPFCPLQCSAVHAVAWTKASTQPAVLPAIQNLTMFLLPGLAKNNAGMLNDTFNNLCMVYKSYSNCLEQCPPAALTNNLRQGVTALSVLCDPNKSDYLAKTPCLYDHSQLIQNACKGTTDELSNASTTLKNLYNSQGVGFALQALPSIRQLCSSAMKQANCVLPIVQQQCGDQASDLIRSILNASVTTLREVVGNDLQQLMSSECASFFHMVENGSPVFTIPAIYSNTTNITMAMSTNISDIDRLDQFRRSLDMDMKNDSMQSLNSGSHLRYNGFIILYAMIMLIV